MKNIQVLENCHAEWDMARGVLYVYNKVGATALRVSGVPVPFTPEETTWDSLIDIRAAEKGSSIPTPKSTLQR